MSLKDALAGIKEAHDAPEPKDKTERPKRAERATAPTKAEKPRRGRAVGKSADPAFRRMTVYVPNELRKKAERKWEDATGKDLSDLAVHLLTKYLNA